MGKKETALIEHPISPVYDENSEILILGSFPSVKSREVGVFYGHKQNRFWKVMAAVFNDKIPESTEEKKAFLHKNHIALWDVIASCEIKGSSDSSIKNVKANDLSLIFITLLRNYTIIINICRHCLRETPSGVSFPL